MTEEGEPQPTYAVSAERKSTEREKEVVRTVICEKKGLRKIDDDSYDELIDSAEKAFGMKFVGDREKAKFYLDEFVAGVVAAMELKNMGRFVGKVRLGLTTDSGGLATASFMNGNLREPVVCIDFSTLQDMCFYDSDEDYYNFGRVFLGPTWYAARELGVEEGAHIAYIKKRRSKDLAEPWMNYQQYHQTDVEFDGLNARIMDAQFLLDDIYLSASERKSIGRDLIFLKGLMKASHKGNAERDYQHRRVIFDMKKVS